MIHEYYEQALKNRGNTLSLKTERGPLRRANLRKHHEKELQKIFSKKFKKVLDMVEGKEDYIFLRSAIPRAKSSNRRAALRTLKIGYCELKNKLDEPVKDLSHSKGQWVL